MVIIIIDVKNRYFMIQLEGSFSLFNVMRLLLLLFRSALDGLMKNFIRKKKLIIINY